MRSVGSASASAALWFVLGAGAFIWGGFTTFYPFFWGLTGFSFALSVAWFEEAFRRETANEREGWR